LASITVDSNIYVSALNFRGKPLQLLEKAAAGEVDIAVSDSILGEVLRVLRDKFEWSEERLSGAESFIKSIARHVNPTKTLDVVKDDPDDNRILECAQASGSEFVITGDLDLLRLGEYAGIKIVRLSDFLNRSEFRSR
jgi:putative PIN family toxin of toxin-antitoxin system